MIHKDQYKLLFKTGSFTFILAIIVILITCRKIEREAKVETKSISEITTNSAKLITGIAGVFQQIRLSVTQKLHLAQLRRQ
jgi:hypothetical protein